MNSFNERDDYDNYDDFAIGCSGGGGGGSGGPTPSSFGGGGASPSGNQVNHSPPSQESSHSQSELVPHNNHPTSSSSLVTQPLPSQSAPRALPGPQLAANPLLLPSPDDPSGNHHAAKLLALSTTPRPITGI